MSMIIDGTNGLTFNNATTQASAGVILQVVQSSTIANASTTSNSFVTTGISISITPKFATSKILIGAYGSAIGIPTNAQPSLTFYRGGSNLGGTEGQLLTFNANASLIQTPIVLQYLDSPATTSSTTYTLYWRNANNSATIVIAGGNNVQLNLFAWEIAA